MAADQGARVAGIAVTALGGFKRVGESCPHVSMVMVLLRYDLRLDRLAPIAAAAA
jgi:hypothetical protein